MNLRNTIFAVGLLTSLSIAAQNKISISNIYKKPAFSQNTVSGFRSTNDGKHYTILERSAEISKYDYKKGVKQETLFSLMETPIENERVITDYALSSDEKKILLTTSRKYIYRHSYISAHYIYDITTKKLTPVFEIKQQKAKISPNGDKVAFVAENNLYIKDLKTETITQVTFDGKHGEIINGMADWVYEEEFTLGSAFEWSPDGNKLAFIRFDESSVKEFQIPMYKELYPEWYKFKYPKAGEENAIVSVLVFDMATGKLVTMDLGEEKDMYISRIKWTNSSEYVCAIRLNRTQNKADVLFCNTSNGQSKVLLSEKNKKFISEITDDFITFLSNNEGIIALGEKSGYKHLYLYNNEGKLINAITSGNWEISELLGIDQKNKCLYYTSTEVSPLERHVYKINFDGTGKKKLSLDKGTNHAIFSKTFDYYINYYSSASTPLNVKLYSSKGKYIRTLEENTKLKESAKDYGFVAQEFFNFTGPSGDKLNGYMFKPANFDKGKKYPVLMYVYGGPSSQNVKDEWNLSQPWFQMLTQQGYIVACVDNRGTDGRGEKFQKSTYLQLGKLEVEDQIAAAEYLAQLNYIDGKRIGMFGWSYGGFMTLNCLMQGNHIFKMGIAVAPVTNWRYYDTIYTERYMRKPQDNSSGYDDNSPINHVDGLKGKLLLIHGSGDDNVHFQNSMMLTEELIQKDKQFEMMFYPNKNHGIYGGNTRYHLYTKMTNFLLENL